MISGTTGLGDKPIVSQLHMKENFMNVSNFYLIINLNLKAWSNKCQTEINLTGTNLVVSIRIKS